MRFIHFRFLTILIAFVLLSTALRANVGPFFANYYYRFEEGDLDRITDWFDGSVAGTHNALYSEDVAFEIIPRSCESNDFSLAFGNGSVASFTSTFVFHADAAAQINTIDPAQININDPTLEFLIKILEPQESSIFWTETAGEDRNRYNIYLSGTSIGGEYRDVDGTIHEISNGTRELALDTWTYIAIIRDEADESGHRYQWYFDGVVEPNLTIIDTSPSLPVGEGWTIGGRPGFPFTGFVDEIYFWILPPVPDRFLTNGGPDRNNNGIPDRCDIQMGASQDCNVNQIPDELDIEMDVSQDLNENAIPDECDPDCNGNGVPDDLDISSGFFPDCNGNGVPDECDIDSPLETLPAETYIDAFDVVDQNGDIERFEESDCLLVGEWEEEEDYEYSGRIAVFANYSSYDPGAYALLEFEGTGVFWLGAMTYNAGLFRWVIDEGRPEEVSGVVDTYIDGVDRFREILLTDQLTPGLHRLKFISLGRTGTSLGRPSHDCNQNGIPDECDFDSGLSHDCNDNGIPDECDFDYGLSQDSNTNSIPDECEHREGGPYFTRGDVDGNGVMDISDPISNLTYQFLNDFVPPCLDAADTDDSGFISIADPITSLAWQILGRGSLAPPVLLCGLDPTPDAGGLPGDLGCLSPPMHCMLGD